MNELESILNYLETTSLEPHNDYTSEFTYKDQKILWNYIKQLQQKEDIINKAKEYITSYESISEIQGLDNIKENKYLDEKTMDEMIRRYMNLHDKILEILDNKGYEF